MRLKSIQREGTREAGHLRAAAAALAFTLGLSGILIVPGTALAAYVTQVPMGSLTGFSVLAATVITDTGGTSTFSDGAGVSPGTTITGIEPGDVPSGGLHLNDAAAQQAQSNLATAYAYASALPATTIDAELGGKTLLPGVHRPNETALSLTGVLPLILNGAGDPGSVFVIQTAGALDTAASTTVQLTNGAQECNVFWQVAGAVTLGANSTFRGNILATGAVTVGAGVAVSGRAFTRAGAMTLSDNDFLEPTCAGVTVVPSATPLVTTEAGGTATFTVVLNSQPTGDVTIDVSSSNALEGTVPPADVTFTTGNWATPQTVTVTGVNDLVDDGDVGYTVILAAAAGGGYAGVDPADVSASNTDNDDPTPVVIVVVGGGGVVSPPVLPPRLVDTSAACPDSIAGSGFGDISGFDGVTVQAINCIFLYGISNGTSELAFTPSGTVSRWQMALFLIRQLEVHGVALPSAMDQGFTDIGGYNQATKDAINRLAQFGITKGSGIATFSPSDAVSRWEMALFLVRFASVVGILPADPNDPSGFTDMESFDPETKAAVDHLVELGVAAGTSASTFEPSNDVLRWQMALFLTRLLAIDGIVPR